MLFDVLQGIVAHLAGMCVSAYEGALFKLAFMLAFFGALRIGELVSPSKKVHGAIWGHEVLCKNEGVSLMLRISKTDQLNKDRLVKVFPLQGFFF